MPILKLNKQNHTLQDQIDDTLDQMSDYQKDTDEFERLLANLEKLYKLKSSDKNWSVSPDVIVAAAANIGGILLVLNFERMGVVTSKAFGMLTKLKL